MRHQVHSKRFGRRGGGRKALIRGLVNAIVESERIRTTVPKAKELRRHIERAITKGKDQTLHARRILLAKYPNLKTVEKIVSDLSPRFQKRPGGYTRILRLDRRPGDSAEMCFIEFVDYKTLATKPNQGDNKEEPVEAKTASSGKSSSVKAKKKGIRKAKSKTRKTERT
ncbi:MAG: 50S ribosomal protein L17 [Pseudomonadota bacterium]|nr:50S ribosomal protein L17 [Pseudomonadota bacterium]